LKQDKIAAGIRFAGRTKTMSAAQREYNGSSLFFYPKASITPAVKVVPGFCRY
jgi:hypothetical protein